MTFDDLRSHWQETDGRSISPEEREELIARVCRRAERFGATVFRRDLIETAAAVFVVVAFGGIYLWFDELVVKLGAAIVVIGSLYIVYKLHRTRMDRKPSSLDASVRDFCKTEIERVDRQIHLLRSVLWWYIAPLIVGINVMTFGIQGVGVFSIGYCLFAVLFGWFVYRLNQWAVAKSFLPVRGELAGLLDELGESE